MTVLEAANIVKRYTSGDGSTITVLDGLSLAVEPGEMVAVVGASGAGKSTLLHILGALDLPTSGSVTIAGIPFSTPLPSAEAVSRADQRRQRNAEAGMDRQISEMRNRSIGFVFQFHHLLREFSALENVMMPLLVAGETDETARGRARELLGRVGLASRLEHRPSELSGGEQQRAAVARALAVRPAILLADEPSGNLDHGNSERLHDLLVEVARESNVATVVATHNRSLAARADRVLVLDAGTLHEPTNGMVVQ